MVRTWHSVVAQSSPTACNLRIGKIPIKTPNSKRGIAWEWSSFPPQASWCIQLMASQISDWSYQRTYTQQRSMLFISVSSYTARVTVSNSFDRLKFSEFESWHAWFDDATERFFVICFTYRTGRTVVKNELRYDTNFNSKELSLATCLPVHMCILNTLWQIQLHKERDNKKKQLDSVYFVNS